MLEMKKIRDEFDYHGGRAIGSREMLDIRDAEYGERCCILIKVRITLCGLWSIAVMKAYASIGIITLIHIIKMVKETVLIILQLPENEKQADASVYNRNQDSFTIENVIRWFDYWRERPGTGKG